jgi:hypothetical protein
VVVVVVVGNVVVVIGDVVAEADAVVSKVVLMFAVLEDGVVL